MAGFSIVTPVYNPPLGAFLACVAGVRAQEGADWEWCLVDDCSTRPEVRHALDEAAASDPRIRVAHRAVNGGIVAASNDALAMATKEFVVLLDHDDAIVPGALAAVAAVLDRDTGDEGLIDYLYTDEAHVLADGRETAHFLKPGWSPERFRASMYTCHLSVLRRSLVAEIGGFRQGFDGSQDHDLILRATEAATERHRRVVHLPILAYHWRNISTSVSRASSSLATAIDNGRRAVQEQCGRLGIAATVEHGPTPGTYRLRRALPAGLTVTVVVATAGETAALPPHRLAADVTLRGVRTTFPAATLVVAHPESLPAPLTDLVHEAAGDRWHPVAVPGPWSIARGIDHALQCYPADVVVSIAPGLVPRSETHPDWLETLAGLAVQAGHGIAGGLVSTPDSVVAHAGWDVPNYRWYELEGLPVGTPSSGNDLLIERECSQVSLAAAALTTAHWRECRASAVGPWHQAGRALSDALAAGGLRVLWTPFAELERAVAVDLGDGLTRARAQA